MTLSGKFPNLTCKTRLPAEPRFYQKQVLIRILLWGYSSIDYLMIKLKQRQLFSLITKGFLIFFQKIFHSRYSKEGRKRGSDSWRRRQEKFIAEKVEKNLRNKCLSMTLQKKVGATRNEPNSNGSKKDYPACFLGLG